MISTATDPAAKEPTANEELAAAKELAVSWLRHLNGGRMDDILRTTAPHWRMSGGPPDLPSGPDGIRALFAHLGPVEQTWEIADVIAEGDRVVVRATNTCIQESLFGLPAAGIAQVFTATFTFRIADGLVHEIWRNADDLGRVLQLGARIEPAGATS
jgi:predicted SnoaL-like aldol condensation-catalyzing enzyme